MQSRQTTWSFSAIRQPTFRARRNRGIETKINGHLQEDQTGQHWGLHRDGAQWGIVLEALRRYQAHAEDGGTHPGLN